MNILISSRKEKSDYEKRITPEAVRGVSDLYPEHNVYSDESIDWESWRAQYGGWEGAYEYAASAFDLIVLVEGTDSNGQFLARGQYQLARLGMDKGKQVMVWRAFILHPVRQLREISGIDWKSRFGEVTI